MKFSEFIDLSGNPPRGSLRAAASAGDLARVEALLAAWRAQCPVDAQGELEFTPGDCDAYVFPDAAAGAQTPEWAQSQEMGPRWVSSLMLAAQKGHFDCLSALLPFSNAAGCNATGLTALHLAAAHGHARCVEILAPVSRPGDAIRREADIDRGYGFRRQGLTALHLAARQGHLDCVNILAPISNPGQADANGLTPLFLAAFQDHLECVKALLPLSKRVIWKEGCYEGRTVLMAAAAAPGQKTSCLEHLLPSCDPNAEDAERWTALFFAAQAGNLRALELLLPLSDLSIRSTGTGRAGESALHLAARSMNQAAAQMLLPCFDANEPDSDGNTALAIAATFGNAQTAQALLPFSNPNALNKNGRSAFSLACESPSDWDDLLAQGYEPEHCRGRETMELLVSLAPFSDVNLQGTESLRMTPLAFLAKSGAADALCWLARRSDQSLTLSDGATPLMVAAIRGLHPEAVAALAPFFDVNAQNHEGQTALMLAALHRESTDAPNGVAMALAAWPGVDFEKRDHLGRTALLLAAVMGNVHLARAILSRAPAALARVADNEGRTPLSLACEANSVELIQALLSAGAGPDALIPDAYGDTPLMLVAARPIASEAIGLLLPFSDATARNNAGYTALDISLDGNELGVLALLPASDLCAQNPLTGHTPLIVAATQSHSPSFEAVAAATPSHAFNIVDKDGRTALMHAMARSGKVDRACLEVALLAAETNVEARDNAGLSVFDILIESRSWDFLDTLLAHVPADRFERAFLRCAAILAPTCAARFESMTLAREAGMNPAEKGATRKNDMDSPDDASIFGAGTRKLRI